MRTFLAMTAALLAPVVAAAAMAMGYSHYRERCAEIRDDVENWISAVPARTHGVGVGSRRLLYCRNRMALSRIGDVT